MELVNTNDENSFDPTPRLKTSPVPIKFISFNCDDNNCFNCGEKYVKALLSHQKYCKKCLSRYINDITDDNNIYLDVYSYTKRSKRKISRTEKLRTLDTNTQEFIEQSMSRPEILQNIQRHCGSPMRILCFKQIDGYIKRESNNFLYNDKENDEDHIIMCYKVIESEKNCKLCGRSLHTYKRYNNLTLCSNCYLISSELTKSTLVKKQISILYLPWWHNRIICDICNSKLIFTSDCQKYCENCYIFYTGCRYCLTTNIIFGPTLESQCKKCKKTSLINCDFDDILFNNNLMCNNLDYLKLAGFKNIGKYFAIGNILDPIFKEKNNNVKAIKWIPYTRFKYVKEMTKGGYGIIYKAIWLRHGFNETVILKRFENSKNNSKYFLNELKSNQQCFNQSIYNHIIKIFGFTKDPKLGDHILVMKYASGGDLNKYLQNSFANITWNNQKLNILWQISNGLEHIHRNKFIHRDFHSGNILFDLYNDQLQIKNNERYRWKIGDLGLSHEENNNLSENEIYGVIPYIAPEIFKGSAFSKEADIYGLGMVMWELTTSCKPFSTVKHDIQLVYKILDGERPKITEDTPECYANLMKSCWDPDPKKRPSIEDIRLTLSSWAYGSINEAEFSQAESKRKKLLELKEIGPEFAEKCHPEAIYTSRPLSALISKCSSTSSTYSTSTEDYISKEQELDIDTKSLSSQNLSLKVQNVSSSLKKRSIEELNLEIDDNSAGKRIKSS